jgi:hypothetical protein
MGLGRHVQNPRQICLSDHKPLFCTLEPGRGKAVSNGFGMAELGFARKMRPGLTEWVNGNIAGNFSVEDVPAGRFFT